MEEHLRQLKRSRSAAKGSITKVQNEIKDLLLDVKNIDSIKEKIPDLDAAMDSIEGAHDLYHANLTDECDIEESLEYFEAEKTRVCNLKQRINTIAAATASRGSTTSSESTPSVYSSCSSSRALSRKGVLAKRAALKAQAALLERRQKLQEEEFRLRQRMEQLELETELAKASAEVKAYNSDECSDGSESENDDGDRDGNKENDQIDDKAKTFPKIETSTKDTESETKHTASQPVETSHPKPPETITGDDTAASKVKLESEDTLLSVISAQKVQTQHIENLLVQQQRHTLALMLPQPQVPTFDGNPTNYCDFIRSFENLIELKTDSDSSRLYYLVQYTSGDVKELMRSCLSMPPKQGYQEARRLLKQRYGQSYKIAASLVSKLTEYNYIKSESGDALRKFSTLLTSCRNTLKEIGFSSKIENPDTLRRIVDKLPYGLRIKWRDIADKITEKEHREITVDDLAAFVEDRARIAAHPIFGDLTSDKNMSHTASKTREDRNPRRNVLTFGTQVSSTESSLPRNSEKSATSANAPTTHKARECPSCCKNHWLSQCQIFREKSLEERRKFVREKSLCDNCLTHGHIASTCTKSSFCKVDGCTQKHSTFLHPKSTSDCVSSSSPQSNIRNGYVKGRSAARSKEATALPIVPVNVKVKGRNEVIQTYAFLDGGSNTTFCTERLKNELNAQGNASTLSITTIEKTDSPTETMVMSLQVSALDNVNKIDLPTVYSIPRLPVSNESIASEIDISSWPHLRDLRLPSIDAEVGLLIGSDVPQALQPVEVRGGHDGEPYAQKTLLGWSVIGPMERKGSVFCTSSSISPVADLDAQFKSFCNMEFNDAQYDESTNMSPQDKRALDIMNKTIEFKDGHYEMALPWKNDLPSLENNRSVALHRLLLLKKRLSKDPKLLEKYKTFIDNLLEKKHARRVIDAAKPEKVTWYLPHHPVLHPKKPDKVRVVYDCSAKFKGKSLNDELLQGPDLTNSLIGVLIRFREEPVAFMADVESMFYQVRVAEEDRSALRFLWFKDGDLDGQIEEFQMNVHLFGGTSSPSCSNFALRRTADDHSNEFSTEAAKTVKDNFYVDDCLKAVATEKEAIHLAEELRSLLARGGFRLTKWTSNSTQVLASIPEQERAQSVKSLDFGSLHVERALGIQWSVASDTFGFAISIRDRPATRRGILSTVSSIYDPLGFLAPYTLPAKMLLQDLCRAKLGWDDPIPAADLQRWQNWLLELPHLEGLAINRCFKPEGFGEITSAQLHTFSDASLTGYGGATYLRIIDKNGRIHCAFIHGKSRLAPLKSVTIPRLELSTAVLGTRLEQIALKELSVTVTEKSKFWTDSTCVLAYINNDNRRFHTFVANRIAAIQERTSSNQWQYIDTTDNPADDASRGLPPKAAMEVNNRWLNGPDFLWSSEELFTSKLPTASIRTPSLIP